jgi:excisionase family DNA binding protein
MTSSEVAEVCGVNRVTIVRWIQNGGLKAETTLGGRYRINIESLLEQANAGGIFISPDKKKMLMDRNPRNTPANPVIEAAFGKDINTTQVLVIDDDIDIRNMLKEFLTIMGYTVLLADNGFKALDYLLKNYSIKLVILDLLMPGINGLETLDKIKSLRSNVAIIVTSGFIDYYYPNGSDALNKKVNAVLKKPFDLDELARVCRQLLNQ